VLERGDGGADTAPAQARRALPQCCSILPAKSERRVRRGRRNWFGYTGVTGAKYFLSVLVGCVVGLLAAGLEESTTILLHSKTSILQEAVDFHSPRALWISFGVITVCSLALALVAGLLVQFVAPAAAGGKCTPL
jgi:hypothetical protein